MHPYLDRLGIRPEVQAYFSPYYDTGEAGNLYFAYGDSLECYGMGFHKMPLNPDGFWLAGNLCFGQVDRVMICASAMEAIAWVDVNWYRITDSVSLLFFSAGIPVSDERISWLRKHCAGKKIVVALGNDLLGRLSAVKLAAGLRGLSLQVCYLAEEKVQILFRGQTWHFSPANLSVHALEKLSGFRFRVIISTPKNYPTFFEQVRAAAGLAL